MEEYKYVERPPDTAGEAHFYFRGYFLFPWARVTGAVLRMCTVADHNFYFCAFYI